MAEKIDFVNPYDSVLPEVERSHPELANNGGVGIQLTPTKETPSAALLREQLDKSIAGITKPNP